RLSSSRSIWVAAIRFRLDQLLVPEDVQTMILARRLIINYHHHSRQYEKFRTSVLTLVRAFTTAIDLKDRYTGAHSERVARIASRLGDQLGLQEEIRSDLFLTGLFHDVGKISIRDEVLLKRSPLTADEWEHLK